MTTLPTASATPVPLERNRAVVCHEVLMVGTRLDVRGGISAVVRSLHDGGLFERFSIDYIATHRDGSAFAKARAALRGYAHFSWRLLTADAPLVHIHLASRASFWRKSVVCALSMLRGRPYLLHVHGGEFGKFYAEECGRFARWLIRTLFRRARFVLALSDHWCMELQKISPHAAIRRLPNAVKLPACPVRQAAGQPVRILFAGLLTERKGAFDLLRAFARVATELPSAHIVYAGTGETESLLTLAKLLNVADRVTCAGWLSPADMAAQFAQTSVFALPSYAEGVPMALLEAMSWGIPVVTTPVGGIPEVVQSDRNGLLVAPGDIPALERALARLLASPEMRTRLGSAARNTVAERFSLDSAIANLASIYRELGLADKGA